MTNLWETLRSLDIFGAPIGLTYKGENTFQTMIGGCLSFTTWLVILVSAIVQLTDHFKNQEPQQIISSIFQPYNTNGKDDLDRIVNMDTTQQVIAGNLIYGTEQDTSSEDYIPVNQLARINFYSTTLHCPDKDCEEFTTEITWHNTIPCEQKYADENLKKDNYVLWFEFVASQGWICPDLDEIVLNNDPRNFHYYGTSFTMVVNTCEATKKLQEEHGLSLYDSDVDCYSGDMTDLQITKAVQQLQIRQKEMTNNARNKYYFEENGKMQRYFTNRQSTGLSALQSKIVTNAVTKVRVNFDYNRAWYQYIPAIKWFLPANTQDDSNSFLTYDFKQTDIETFPYGTYKSNPEYGFVSYMLYQDPNIIKVNWTSESVLDILTRLITQYIALYGGTRLLIQHYQSFAHTKSSIKQLYFDEKMDHNPGEDDFDDYRERMRRQISSQSEFSMGYFTYVFVRVSSYLCCCCAKYLDTAENEGLWYRKNMQKIRKIRMAREKLKDELEVQELINMKRLTQFFFKFTLKRRQRILVNYFKRFMIRNEDLSEEAIAKSKRLKRGISVNRMVNECDPDSDVVDRRIVYEMTGIKLVEEEFKDDSSLEGESERSNSAWSRSQSSQFRRPGQSMYQHVFSQEQNSLVQGFEPRIAPRNNSLEDHELFKDKRKVSNTIN